MTSSSNYQEIKLPEEVLLPEGDVFDAIRSSCREALEHSEVKVVQSKVEKFLNKVVPDRYEQHRVDRFDRLPLCYESFEEELNVTATLALLAFGDAYNTDLVKQTKRSIFEIMRLGVISNHIAEEPMSAATYKRSTVFKISRDFMFQTTEDYQEPSMPYVTLTKPNLVAPLAVSINTVLHSTADFLESNKYPDMATFILDITKPVPGQRPSASNFIKRIVKALPAFRDAYIFNGKPVYFFKKAQLLAYQLHKFYKTRDPDRFDFEDIGKLTVCSDGLLPLLFDIDEIISMPDQWMIDIESCKEIKEFRVISLRAIAVVASEHIVRCAKTHSDKTAKLGMTEYSLGTYFTEVFSFKRKPVEPRIKLLGTVMF